MLSAAAGSQRGARILRWARSISVVVAAAGALALTGIGSETATARIHAATETTLTSYNGQRGSQLVVETAGQKLTLYNFSRDAGKSSCYRACRKVWLPLIAHGRLVATPDSHINSQQLGTVKRRDGSRQVTYYGQPLYRYRHDTKSGQIRGADKYQFGGSWGVMGVNGGVLARPGY